MPYISHYASPLGPILLAADGTGLTGLWFNGQKYYPFQLEDTTNRAELPIFKDTKRWLDVYFSGREPDFILPLHLTGTPFQNAVWEILRSIPYGKTLTYGEIARRLAQQKNLPHMSAQAVGGAVGHNKLSIIIPCHRVVGTNGSLTGYAGGLDRKTALLKLEGVDTSAFFTPAKGTAP